MTPADATVDWLIVGAGSAGCVLAARLADLPTGRVLLLEAGGAPPAAAEGSESSSFFDVLDTPAMLWDDLRLRRRSGSAPVAYPRGRVLGGCSAVNAMVALAGGPFAHDPAAQRHRIPIETVGAAELGPVDRALLAADADAVPAPLNRRNGRRVSAFDAYLGDGGAQRVGGNLEIRTDAEVARVLFDGVRATGVELVTGEQIRARRVVLSAGALGSPVLLLRSGVRVAGLGEGLADHPAAAITLELRADIAADPASNVCGALLARSDAQVLSMNHLGHRAPGYAMLLTAVMRPRSRGRIVLSAPDAEPDIDLALLSDPHDRVAMVDAVAATLELLGTDAFVGIVESAFIDDHGTTIDALFDSAGAVSRRSVEEWVIDHLGDYVHASGGCAMGHVVDEEGSVSGYEALYVCDASVFATIPEVNTHLPTVMLAETMAARWTARGRSPDGAAA